MLIDIHFEKDQIRSVKWQTNSFGDVKRYDVFDAF